jgi:hypothetical protein
MCRLCEGGSWDEVIADAGHKIARNGFTLVGVGDDHTQSPWMYTTGLVDTADHPELVIAGVEVGASAEILDALAGAVMDGERIEVGARLRVGGHLVRIGAVDDVHRDLDTFAMWHRLHDAGMLHAPSLSVVQVLLEHGFCADHQRAQPVLADPAARVGTRTAENRAARRRRARAERHRRTSR